MEYDNATGIPGPQFYDDETVFARYMAHRDRLSNPNETIEGPAFALLLGSVADKRILDLGCGDARFALALLNDGCRSYLGVEGSSNMVAAARQRVAGSIAQVVHAGIENWNYPEWSFDIVTSRLALHYIDDVHALFDKVFRALVPGGRFVFSVEHPVITSFDKGWPEGTERQGWVVDDYFKAGPRVTSWMGGTPLKYHRTVEDYFNALKESGFQFEALSEARPERERFERLELYTRRIRIPLFLLMSASKPGAPR